MNRKFKMLMIALVLGMGAMGCASSQVVESAAVHNVMLRVANAEADAEALQSEMSAKREAWYFDVEEGDSGTFNTLRKDDAGYAVCLAPDRAYDENGKTAKYLPMTCGSISSANAAQEILALYDAQYTAGVDALLSHTELREIVNRSTPEDPLCFSILPLWLADNHMFAAEPVLSESYMIVCARKIMPENKEGAMLSERLATWMNMTASVLTTDSGFVSRAFRQALSHNDAESLVFGQALEAHVEMFAAKWTQSQITLSSAMNANERLNIDWFSEIIAMMMFRSLSETPNPTTVTFEQIARAIAPQKPADLRLDVRNLVSQKICMMSTTLPDVTPELVDACLGSIALGFISTNEEIHNNYALMLRLSINSEHAYLTETTRSWIGQFCQETTCPWFKELSHKALAEPNLEAETRTFFETIQIKESE